MKAASDMGVLIIGAPLRANPGRLCHFDKVSPCNCISLECPIKDANNDRSYLNEEMVERGAIKAREIFVQHASAGQANDVLWQIIAATVILETVRFMRGGGNILPFRLSKPVETEPK